MATTPPAATDPARALAERLFAALLSRTDVILRTWLANAPPDLDAVVTQVCDAWLGPVAVGVRHNALFLSRTQTRGFPLVVALGPELARDLARGAAAPALFRAVAEEGGRPALARFGFDGLAPRRELAEAAVRQLQHLILRHCGSEAAQRAARIALRRALKRYEASPRASRNFARPFLQRRLRDT